MTNPDKLTHPEQALIWRLSSIMGLRLFGLFMVLPVFAVGAVHFPDYTPWLMGFALGGYGLTQALMQIPAGWFSDILGRRQVILIGLSLFILGSILAAAADTLWLVLFGRLLQGTGAIAAPMMALLADEIPASKRSRAMAFWGMGIGGAFMLALILGPLLFESLRLSGLFYLIAFLGAAAWWVAFKYIPALPATKPRSATSDISSSSLGFSVRFRFYASIFVLHAMLVALFAGLPQKMVSLTEAPTAHFLLYLLVMLGSFIVMFPFLKRIEEKGQFRVALLFAVGLIALSLWLLSIASNLWGVSAALFCFFLGFHFLEAKLPSQLAKVVSESTRGRVMGFYSSSQFLGAFLGGSLTGVVLTYFSNDFLWQLLASLCLVWLVIVLTEPAFFAAEAKKQPS